MWTVNFQMFKLVLEKAEEPEIKLDQIANIRWIIEKAKELEKNIYFCFIDFDCVDHKNCGKFWKRWEYRTTWPASFNLLI